MHGLDASVKKDLKELRHCLEYLYGKSRHWSSRRLIFLRVICNGPYRCEKMDVMAELCSV